MTKLFHNQTFNKIVLVVGSCCLLLLIFGAFHYSKANRINTYLKARSVPSGRVFENIKEYWFGLIPRNKSLTMKPNLLISGDIAKES